MNYLLRSVAIASISSKKIIAGDAFLAFRNISLTVLSDSPTHLEKSSGPFLDYMNHKNLIYQRFGENIPILNIQNIQT